LSDVTTLATGVVIGVVVGTIPALASVFLTGRQQHAEARFEFYRDKADILSGYVASVYQMVVNLADIGVNLGVMGHTISFSPTLEKKPSLEESRASLTRRLEDLVRQYDKFQEDGTLVLMPEMVITSMRDANDRVTTLRNIIGTTPDLAAYFRDPRQFNYLITQSLRSVEIVRETLQKELGLKTTDQSKFLKE